MKQAIFTGTCKTWTIKCYLQCITAATLTENVLILSFSTVSARVTT